MRVFDPLEHFDYGELDLHCCCAICEEWRSSLAAMKLIEPIKQKYGNNCSKLQDPTVIPFVKARSIYHAALNRREMYCELSYHAAQNKNGGALMDWAGNLILDRKRADSWWERYGNEVSLGYWLTLFMRERGLGVQLARVI